VRIITARAACIAHRPNFPSSPNLAQVHAASSSGRVVLDSTLAPNAMIMVFLHPLPHVPAATL